MKTERLEARLSEDHDELLRWAASSRGLGLSAFVIEAAVERAEKMRDQELLTRLPREQEAAFRAWLDQPVQDNDEMARLAAVNRFQQR